MGRKMANVSFSPCVPCVCQRGGGNCISFSVRLLCNILRAKGGGLKKHIRRPPLLRTKMSHHSPYIRTQQHPTKYSTNLIGVCVKGGRKQRQQKEQKLHCPTEGGRTGSQDKGGGEQQQRIGAQSDRRRGGSLGHRKSSRRESQKVSSLTMGSPPPFFWPSQEGGVWTTPLQRRKGRFRGFRNLVSLSVIIQGGSSYSISALPAARLVRVQ